MTVQTKMTCHLITKARVWVFKGSLAQSLYQRDTKYWQSMVDFCCHLHLKEFVMCTQTHTNITLLSCKIESRLQEQLFKKKKLTVGLPVAVKVTVHNSHIASVPDQLCWFSLSVLQQTHFQRWPPKESRSLQWRSSMVRTPLDLKGGFVKAQVSSNSHEWCELTESLNSTHHLH